MRNGYKKAITERVKDSVNNWILKIKEEHQELLLTKQWKVLFPKGFKEGHNVLPVVTGSKKGKHLIGEVQFVLPESLDLDIDSVELVLKNEPFKEKRNNGVSLPIPLDEPLDVLNSLVVGVNEFLQSLNINTATQAMTPLSLFPTEKQQSPLRMNAIPTAASMHLEAAPPFDQVDDNLIEKVRSEMLKSPHLPIWLKTVESREVYDGVLNKLVGGLIHYQRQIGKPVELEDFFAMYTDHLKSSGKLYDFCRYKGKPVNLNDSEHCLENYCTKKPYNAPCKLATLKFGTPPEN